jgi:hypothetical protein
MNIIEKQLTTNEGFTAVVVFHNTLFHRCGYIGLPIEIANKIMNNEDNEFMDMDLDVHGGITYESPEQGYPIETDEPFYWIGFDCGHLGDSKDFEAADAYMEAGMNITQSDYDANVKYFHPSGTIKTLDYVVSECNGLSEQIANLRDYTYPEDNVSKQDVINEINRRIDTVRPKTTKSFDTYEDGYYAALGELLEWIE